ncbi:MBL fold metallo-hydrolase [Chelatococcus sp. SYSU_G07232]|uniref:MBL fold metallo-hydrolase n=1 Tax=Chelatococcus albus TaxID=3047466 RepID=A0ABT7AHG3_9HYPH|nr:MBL fold metallo-hydrolase [Chelatococcus sp. SYSU_G07232]MDJ1158808.1 MBL fold metallo-hydrolase [Chelatococcus sp. SYSU_G07232]
MTSPTAEDTLQVRFWGVRGSHPASGPDMRVFGGHTACVEVRCGERLFIVDAGTGITALGLSLGDQAPAEINILLSHLHHDHVTGLPFFKPALKSTRTVRLHCGNLGGESAKAALDRLFSPPLFPVRLDQLPARFEHVGFHAGETLHFADGFTVPTCPLQHPSGATAFRFEHRGRVVCYVSDVEHDEAWPPENLRRFVQGADLVIYDAMFSEDEFCRCRGWGHSTWQAGVALCRSAGAKALAAFHLHPHADDACLEALDRTLREALPGSFVAREGQTVALAPVLAPA